LRRPAVCFAREPGRRWPAPMSPAKRLKASCFLSSSCICATVDRRAVMVLVSHRSCAARLHWCAFRSGQARNLAGTPCARGRAEVLAEAAGEVGAVVEAVFKGDFGHAALRFGG